MDKEALKAKIEARRQAALDGDIRGKVLDILEAVGKRDGGYTSHDIPGSTTTLGSYGHLVVVKVKGEVHFQSDMPGTVTCYRPAEWLDRLLEEHARILPDLTAARNAKAEAALREEAGRFGVHCD